MKAYRIALRKLGLTKKEAFSGVSGFSADGRWHSSGRYLDYSAESLSLAILERLIHYKRFNALEPHVLYALEVPDAAIAPVVSVPPGWDSQDLLPAAQAIGNAWCDRKTSPALLVPSAVTPGEQNLMVNTHHPDWRWSWVISGPKAFAFDSRLIDLVKRRGTKHS